MGSRNGKILRINPDGSVPAGNPFPGSPIWSLGHRNVQGLAWDSKGRLWASELGPGHLRRGQPDSSRPQLRLAAGRGPRLDARRALHQPGRHLAHLGRLAERRGDPPRDPLHRRPPGRGRAALRLDGTHARKLRPLLEGDFGRIRTVARAPDGSLWITTSNRDGRGDPGGGDDRIVRLRQNWRGGPRIVSYLGC